MEGGNTVVITGRNFAGDDLVTRVDFGERAATSFTVVSDTEIRAIAPPAAAPGSVRLRVANADGERFAWYVYEAPPSPSSAASSPPTTAPTSSPAQPADPTTSTAAPPSSPASSPTPTSSPGAPSTSSSNPPPSSSSQAAPSPSPSPTSTSPLSAPSSQSPAPPTTTTAVSTSTATVTVTVEASGTTMRAGVDAGGALSDPSTTTCWVGIVPNAPGERFAVPFPPACGVASVVIQLPESRRPLNLSVRTLHAWPAHVPQPAMGTAPALVFDAELRDDLGAVVEPATAVVQVRLPGAFLRDCAEPRCLPMLFHYHGGAWNLIRLQPVDFTNESVTLEAETTGFSVFAVAGVPVPETAARSLLPWAWLLVPAAALTIAATPLLLRRRFSRAPIAAPSPGAESKVSTILKEMRHKEELLQFVNNAAHDLANPLTPIRLQLDMLSQAAEERADASQRKALEIVERNVDQMEFLIRDLRDASKLQAGRLRLEREPFDLARLVHEVAESHVQRALNAGLRWNVKAEDSLPVEGDKSHLTRVLTNLITNALKFTAAGGIEIRAGAEGDEALVLVRDTGPGLSAEERARLFKPFSQLAAGVKAEGTGLGLFISKGIVEAHGGRIGCESEGPGTGSAFWFSIPLAGPAQPPGKERVGLGQGSEEAAT